MGTVVAEAHGWEELAVALARMARDLRVQDSVQHTLDQIVDHATSLVDGCEAAGIMVIRKNRVLTLAATDNVARASDRIQDDLREGPCFDAEYREQEAYRIADLRAAEPRWPRYAPQARELGVGSMMGFLLFDGEADLGALDLYSSRAGAFTDRSERVGWILASHGAVAFSSARTQAGLQEAIATRQDIGEALGILMERYKIDEQEAFDRITNVSQNRNIKVRDLAESINRTGQIPDDEAD